MAENDTEANTNPHEISEDDNSKRENTGDNSNVTSVENSKENSDAEDEDLKLISEFKPNRTRLSLPPPVKGLNLKRAFHARPGFETERVQRVRTNIYFPTGALHCFLFQLGETIQMIKRKLEADFHISYRDTVLYLNNNLEPMLEPLSLNDFPEITQTMQCNVTIKQKVIPPAPPEPNFPIEQEPEKPIDFATAKSFFVNRTSSIHSNGSNNETSSVRRNDSNYELPLFTARRNTIKKKTVTSKAALVKHFIESVLQKPFLVDSPNIIKSLRDGVILCCIANKQKEGIIKKINMDAQNTFKMLENVNFFLAACKNFGLYPVELFSPSDLVELKNEEKVMDCILTLQKVLDAPSKKDPNPRRPWLPSGKTFRLKSFSFDGL